MNLSIVFQAIRFTIWEESQREMARDSCLARVTAGVAVGGAVGGAVGKP